VVIFSCITYNEKCGGAILPPRDTRETQGKGVHMDNEDDPHEEDLLAVDNRSKRSVSRLGIKDNGRNQANIAHRFHKKRAVRKVEELMKKYAELQEKGKVDSFLRKRRERASRKEQKYMPKTRVQ